MCLQYLYNFNIEFIYVQHKRNETFKDKNSFDLKIFNYILNANLYI